MDLLISFFLSLIPAADCMASPMIPVFCTPGVKIPSRADSAVLAESPEGDKLPLPSQAATPPPPDFEARWLKGEFTVLHSSYMHFHTECCKQFFKCQFALLFLYSFFLSL